jgi:general stress protein 26
MAPAAIVALRPSRECAQVTRELKADVTRFDDTDMRGAVARLRAKIGDLPVAMVTATDGRCLPTSRPLMTQQLDDDGALWFFVPSDGTLAHDVEQNPRVSATYSDIAHGVYVAMSGYARLIYDPDRIFALWDDGLEAWFGQGPLDPRLALLRVDVDHAEYWDAHSSGVIRLLALAHAALRREPQLPATEHRRLSLRDGNGSAPPA